MPLLRRLRGFQKWVFDAAAPQQWNLAYTLKAGAQPGQPLCNPWSIPPATIRVTDSLVPCARGYRQITGVVNTDGTDNHIRDYSR